MISLLSSDDPSSSNDQSLPHSPEKEKRAADGATTSSPQAPNHSKSPIQQEVFEVDVGWGNDGWGTNAYLEWDGVDRELDVTMDESVLSPSPVHSRSSSPPATQKNRSPSPNRKGKARAKVSSKNKKSKLTQEEDNLTSLLDGTGFNEFLKLMITSNEELYLRILRYEVCSFHLILWIACLIGAMK